MKKDRFLRLATALAVVLGALSIIISPAQAAGTAATDVIGQGGFTNSASNSGGGVSQYGFNSGRGSTIDTDDNVLFVADLYNNRVMGYQLDTAGKPIHGYADYWLGQSNPNSSGAATQIDRFAYPTALAYEHTHRRLFVAEFANHRVLAFDMTALASSMSASYVLGQSDFTSSGASASQTTMRQPNSVAVDDVHHTLFVADYGNSRLLTFDLNSLANGMAASHVLGKPNFSASSCSTGPTGLCYPKGIGYDYVRDLLFVGDSDSRIVVYDMSSVSDGMSASYSLNQPDMSTYDYGVDARRGDQMSDLAIDVLGKRVFIADYNNNRVMVFSTKVLANNQSATAVLGQSDFVSRSAATTQTGENAPANVTFDENSGNLFVSDANNNRVLIYDMGLSRVSTSVSTVVDPTMTFVVGAHAGACNGVSQSAGTSASATTASLGHISSVANGVVAQDLSVTTNAALGFSVLLRSTGAMSDGNGHSIADVAGDDTTPDVFPSPGTPAFGYTTSDATLSGSATRFTSPAARWAKLASSNAPVSFAASGPVTADTVCVAYQMGINTATPAGTYSATVIYTAVPTL